MGETFDPKQLTPGTVLRHESGMTLILSHRNAEDAGWWCADGSWFWDDVLADYWSIVSAGPVG
jgi:hypothetical protein